MTIFRKTLSGAMVAATLFGSAPLALGATYDPIAASQARCERLAGREKERCLYMNNQDHRRKLRMTENNFMRGYTEREQRIVTRNLPSPNIRRIGSYNLVRLKMHNRDGGNARRMIKNRDESARESCSSKEGTELHICIRDAKRGLSKGNTR